MRGQASDSRCLCGARFVQLPREIASAKAAGRKVGICGQAPSDYPEFARFLVEQGIDSISLNPDAVMKTTVTILEAEQARR